MDVIQTHCIVCSFFFSFYFRKSLKISSGSKLHFCGLTFDFFFKVQFISFVERRANSTIEQRKCKGDKKRNRLLVSKYLKFPMQDE